jgi:hypothetical protein
MPPRKYADLAHLSPEEYRKEASKRHEAERKEYHRQKYLKSCDPIRLEERKKRLEEAIALASARLEGLAAVVEERKKISPNDNNGTMESLPNES